MRSYRREDEREQICKPSRYRKRLAQLLLDIAQSYVQDTSQDIYETEDVFLTTRQGGGDSSEDESSAPRQLTIGQRTKGGELVEGVDSSNLISADEAAKKFKTRRHHGTCCHKLRAFYILECSCLDQRLRSIYAYPPSSPPSPISGSHGRSLGTRLRSLQTELGALEVELADPSNPLLHEDDENGESKLNTGDLMRGLVEVRGRLERVKKEKEGRGRLVEAILSQESEVQRVKRDVSRARSKAIEGKEKKESKGGEEESANLVELDRRISELEGLIGSSSVALDEVGLHMSIAYKIC